MYRLNVQVTAYGRQTVHDRGVVKSCDPLQNFGAPIISMERLNLVIKFCTRVGYINSSNSMTYHQQVCGYGHVTVLKFCRLSWHSVSPNQYDIWCGLLSKFFDHLWILLSPILRPSNACLRQSYQICEKWSQQNATLASPLFMWDQSNICLKILHNKM